MRRRNARNSLLGSVLLMLLSCAMLLGTTFAWFSDTTTSGAATIQAGTEGIIHGARTLVMQTDDGQIKEAFTISAGLDYPGIGPMHADLAERGREQVIAINDDEAIYAGYELTRTEGIIPAIESAHAVAALRKLTFRPEDVVVLTVSGRGDKDVQTYLAHKDMAGEYGQF